MGQPGRRAGTARKIGRRVGPSQARRPTRLGTKNGSGRVVQSHLGLGLGGLFGILYQQLAMLLNLL
jgi:hypothetical protein